MNFSDWAVVGFKDDTGIGRMTRDIQEVLGVGRHIVPISERLDGHPVESNRELLLKDNTELSTIKSFMQGLDWDHLHRTPPLARTLGSCSKSHGP